MKRRDFVTLGATTLGAIPMVGFSALERFNNYLPPVKPAWLVELIQLNDKNVASSKAAQVTDPALKSFGSVLDGEEIPNPQATGALYPLQQLRFPVLNLHFTSPLIYWLWSQMLFNIYLKFSIPMARLIY